MKPAPEPAAANEPRSSGARPFTADSGARRGTISKAAGPIFAAPIIAAAAAWATWKVFSSGPQESGPASGFTFVVSLWVAAILATVLARFHWKRLRSVEGAANEKVGR